jgi:hypothetical protein
VARIELDLALALGKEDQEPTAANEAPDIFVQIGARALAQWVREIIDPATD